MSITEKIQKKLDENIGAGAANLIEIAAAGGFVVTNVAVLPTETHLECVGEAERLARFLHNNGYAIVTPVTDDIVVVKVGGGVATADNTPNVIKARANLGGGYA